MEFACKAAGSKLVVVLGHTRCGAITGACDHVELGNLTGLLKKVEPAIERETQTQTERNGKNTDFVTHVTENNVHLGMEQVRKQSPILAEMEQNGEIRIIGGMYDVETGRVDFYEA